MRAALASAKDLVWHRWDTLDLSVLHETVDFHGPAPVGQITGRSEVRERFFEPILSALPNPQWEPHLFLGGLWRGQMWVASTGNLRGRPVAPLFGIPASTATQEVALRYGEFCRIDNGQIVEVRFLFDLLGYAAQLGIELLPPFPAAGEVPPPPALHNGIVPSVSDPEETAITLQLVEDMLGGCNRLVDGELRSMGMDAYWHTDMVWHGPWGIGSSYGFDEFQRYAQGPSVASFPNRRGGFHQARFADGLTAAFTGWPSLQGTFDGAPFRGIEPTGGSIGQNIMDFYVRRGELLHENWVLIDLIDFAAQCGVDLLAGVA